MGRVRKGWFDDEKRGKERKKAAVRGQVPRKQGLKLLSRLSGRALDLRPRASSKKTRIETASVATKAHSIATSEGKFQENKD